MNTAVQVTGMQLKAQAEKGILINEMIGNGNVTTNNVTVDNGTWSESALAEGAVHALRPASTADLTNWWHANSRKTNLEAGINAAGDAVETGNTVAISTGVYYSDISPANVEAETTDASADANCASTVYYTDGTGAQANTYDDGEGYYVKYTYYIKSSSNTPMAVTAGNLQATVTATLQGTGATAKDLDKALRVGIKVNGDTKATIFAPVANSTTTAYKVTGDEAGTVADYEQVTPIAADTATSINAAAVTLPAVTADGLAVYVYVWFEGEDVNCKSDNLAAELNSYQIDITFTDADLG